jgi:hypothetical protein
VGPINLVSTEIDLSGDIKNETWGLTVCKWRFSKHKQVNKIPSALVIKSIKVLFTLRIGPFKTILNHLVYFEPLGLMWPF